jgi:hypothetical protein
MTDKERDDALLGKSSSEDEAVILSRHVPRRPCDQSHVNVRYGTSELKGLARKLALGKRSSPPTQLCLVQGCPYPARVLENFRFCSRTCGRLVSVALWLGTFPLPNPPCVSCLQPIKGGVFRTDHSPIAEATCENHGCSNANRASEGHKFCIIE